MASNELFDSLLISQSVKDGLPQGYTIRALQRNDYGKGFFKCLESLTSTGVVSEERFINQFDWMQSLKLTYYDVVIEHESQIVGNGMLIVEQKFIWDLGKVGHIEEIVVRSDHQGRGLGKRIIQALDSVAMNVGCLKTELNCSDENIPFYIKCGHQQSSVQMHNHFEGFKKWESDSSSGSGNDSS